MTYIVTVLPQGKFANPRSPVHDGPMNMNPRNIAKLCKHLRDAGAYSVTVSADGSVTAMFPQPNQYFIQPTWWTNAPTFVNPNEWTYTYTDGTIDIGGGHLGDPCGSGTITTTTTTTADEPGIFIGANFSGYQASTPAGQSMTFTPV